MKEIKVESTFEKIYNRFKLKYREVTRLEKLFDEEIFYNEKFIKYCLKTNFQDPLLVFGLVLEVTSKHYFDIMNDPMKYKMLNRCWQENYLKSNAVYRIFKNTFSFRDYLRFCRNLTIHKINSLMHKVNEACEIEKNKNNLYLKDDPQFIRLETINFYEKFILNFASHREEMDKEDFNWYNLLYECDDGDKYDYIHASKFWDEYYFSNIEHLKKYAKSTIKDENDYMTFLFDKVIDSLPKYEKYAK